MSKVKDIALGIDETIKREFGITTNAPTHKFNKLCRVCGGITLHENINLDGKWIKQCLHTGHEENLAYWFENRKINNELKAQIKMNEREVTKLSNTSEYD